MSPRQHLHDLNETMTSARFKYSLRSQLPGDVKTAAALGAEFLQTLDVLSRIDPIFDDWHFIDIRGKKSIPLDAARPHITGLVEKNVCRDDSGKREPENGYHAAASTGDALSPRAMNVTIMNAGGKAAGMFKLDAGYPLINPDPAIVTYRVFKAALVATNAIWHPAWANAYAFESGYWKVPIVSGTPPFPYSIFHMSWLAYLSAQLAAGLEVPRDILTEHTPDGGLLMIAAAERLDPTNPEHLRRSRILAEIMIARAGERKE